MKSSEFMGPWKRMILFWIMMGVFLASDVQGTEKILLVTGPWPPYTRPEGDGLINEIVLAVFKKMKRPVEILYLPWKRCEKMLEEGAAFAAFPYVKTQDRNAKFHFSSPLFYSQSKFFYYKRGKIPFSSLQDLQDYVVGGTLGHFYEKDFQQAGLKVVYATQESINLGKLVKGRVDLVPMDIVVGQELINKLFPEEKEFFGTLDKPLIQTELHLMVSPRYPQSGTLLQEFNNALQKLRTSGQYEDIVQKYVAFLPWPARQFSKCSLCRASN